MDSGGRDKDYGTELEICVGELSGRRRAHLMIHVGELLGTTIGTTASRGRVARQEVGA